MKKERLTVKMKNFVEVLKREHDYLLAQDFRRAPVCKLELTDSERKYFYRIENKPVTMGKIGRALELKYDLSLYKDHTNFNTPYQRYEWWISN